MHLSIFRQAYSRTSPVMTVYDIKITSDVVCPWCYIGHARLTKAIAAHKKQYPNDQFKLHYLPFYLAPPPQVTQSPPPPPFPVDTRPRYAAYIERFGPTRAKQDFKSLSAVAASEGLDFKAGGVMGASRNGHRLVHYAQTHGGEEAQNRTMLGLWKRYYEHEIDITQLDVLVEVGLEAELGSEEEIRKHLESDQDGSKVDQLAEKQRRKGISGVPHYTIQDGIEISGGQDSSVFQNVFLKWKEMEAKAA